MTKFFLRFVLGSALVLLPALAGAQTETSTSPFARMTWRAMGPASIGRTTAVAGSAANDKLYYLGSAGGGVWKSVDGART